MTEKTLTISDQDQLRALFGTRDQYLKQVRDRIGIDVVVRGDELRLRGEEANVEEGLRVLGVLREVLDRTGRIGERDVQFALDGAVVRSPDSEFATSTTDSAGSPAPGNRPGSNGDTATTDPASHDLVGGNGHEPANRSARTIDVFEKAKTVVPRTPGQERYVDTIREHDLVFCRGPAGCGKTFLAVAMGIHALRTEQVRKIVLVRPAVEAGERLGFLPGDIFAKVNPYLRPLLDSLNDILDFEQVRTYMEKDVIEIVPLAFMRGRTLGNTFIILDEAQNTTVTQMKMFLTRMGTGSKIVVTGDVTQIDLPEHLTSGLNDAVNRLSHVRGVGSVELDARDIVRHRLVRDIVAAYDQDERGKRSRK